MTKQEKTIQSLVQTLADYTADLPESIARDDSPRLAAMEEMIEHNQERIRLHMLDLAAYLHIKLPQIQELNRVTVQLQKQIEEIKKAGERPTVPTETRPPKQAVNS